MATNKLENNPQSNQDGLKNKLKKGCGCAWGCAWRLLGAAAILSVLSGGISKCNDRRKHNTIKLENDNAKTLDEGNNNKVILTIEAPETGTENADTLTLTQFFNQLLEENSSLNLSVGTQDLIATITNENALKTSGVITRLADNGLEWLGIERSMNNPWYNPLGWFGGKISTGSYGRFQTQREAIDDYKGDSIKYDEICNKVANFKLPNNEGNREELYIQLGCNNAEEMVKKLQDKDYPIYTGGDRLGIALGVVLLNEKIVHIEENNKKYNEKKLDNAYQNVKTNHLEKYRGGSEIRKALNEDWKKSQNLQSIVLLNETTENNGKNRVSFKDIKNILRSPEFISGEAQAIYCTPPDADRNCAYLLALQHAELNQRCDNIKKGAKNDTLEIITSTGTFGPYSTKLARKYFPNLPEDIKEYLDKNPELMKSFGDDAIEKLINNYYTFFLLNGEKETGNGITSNWRTLSSHQMKFLEQSLNLSFNHLYVGVEIFKKYVKSHCSKNTQTQIIKEIDSLWDGYMIDHKKENRKKIMKILTNKDEFTKLTGLPEWQNNTKASYTHFIKYNLGPSLLGTSIILNTTGNIVPEIQDLSGWFSNEKNSIYRFSTGIRNKTIKINEANKGTLIMSKSESEPSMKEIRNAISKNNTVMNYIKENCRDINGSSITNIGSLSDEFINNFIRYETDEDGKINAYFNTTKTNKQIVAHCAYLCKAGKGDTFRDFIYNGQQVSSTLSTILKKITGKETIEKKDITGKVLRQLIRKKDGSIWRNLDRVGEGERFLIVIPITTGIPQNTPGIDKMNYNQLFENANNNPTRILTAKNEIGKTLSGEPNTRNGNRENRQINQRNKSPIPKNIPSPKRYTPQKKG